ncbi:MAG TPA: hypothetical protein VF791_02205 [Pyrinomonadaceae bacterium]
MKEVQRIPPDKTPELKFGGAPPGSLYAQESGSNREIFRDWARRESRREGVKFYYELVLILLLCAFFVIAIFGNFPREVKISAAIVLASVLSALTHHMFSKK